MALEARSSRIPAPAHFPFDGSAPSDAGRGGFGAQIRPATTPADRLLADIGNLAPAIAARSGEFETQRQMPPDVVQTLREIGIFRALVPQSHGGLELDLLPAFEVMTALSRIDGSVGWVGMLGLSASTFLPLLPRALYDQVYERGPDVAVAGSIQPAGTAEAVAGGWRVSGRWPFASGCTHAEWIGGVCVMTRDGQPLPGAVEGMPLMRLVFLPARYWQIEDTWHATGLKGTGSHHVVLRDVLVPEAHFLDPAGGASCVPGPLYTAPLHFIPLMHGPVAVGIAEAALADIVEMARTGRRQFRATKPMCETELFQAELGRAQAELRAAKAYLKAQTLSHWSHARAGTLRGEGLMTKGTQAVIWITQACLRVAETCFALGGGNAVYDSSPLQRRLRDLQAASQHAAVQPRHYVDAGSLLLSGAGRG